MHSLFQNIFFKISLEVSQLFHLIVKTYLKFIDNFNTSVSNGNILNSGHLHIERFSSIKVLSFF